MQNTQPLCRYPFKNIANFRDVGGYAAGPGGMARWGVFFRSGRLTHASPEEIETLKAMGIRTVIDLRMPQEVQTRPDACMQDPALRWTHLHLLEGLGMDSNADWIDPDSIPPMSTLYRWIVDKCHAPMRTLFELLAEGAQRGAVLFHCTAGKDRTGMTAMFLQAICGVDRLDIIAHYEVSHTYNMDVMPHDTSGSHRQNMVELLAHLEHTYGGPVAYLRDIGVPAETIATLRDMLCGPHNG